MYSSPVTTLFYLFCYKKRSVTWYTYRKKRKRKKNTKCKTRAIKCARQIFIFYRINQKQHTYDHLYFVFPNIEYQIKSIIHCLFFFPSFLLSIYLSFFSLTACLPVCLCVCLSVCLSPSLSLSLSLSRFKRIFLFFKKNGNKKVLYELVINPIEKTV